jgi:peroxiredoxin
MQDKMPRRVEIAANISIIIVASLGAYVLLKDHFAVNRPRAEIRAAPARADSRESLVGRPVSLAGVDWAENGQTLLIVLSKGCHFCTESAPFYQKIAQVAAARKGLHVIGILPQEVNEARDYLDQIQVPLADIRQFALGSVGVRGTPTILLIDRSGVIKDAWLGRLQSDKEAEVLKEIACQQCS